VNPTIKIGLSAPFEGRDRDLGYEALHAVRLAVRQRNEAGGLAGRYFVELVALNDFNEPEQAVIQARKMAVDRDVLGVLGGWSPATASSARAEYERLGVPFLAPEEGEITSWAGDDPAPEGTPLPAPAGFVEAFQALSGGAPPSQVAFWAYGAANRLLDAIEAAARAQGQPTRARVWLQLLGQKSD
jgi:ABC-type branched-subunit amino acid transport system substrate-binding protein